VEEQAGSDYAVNKLSTYLSQPSLSLKSALESVSAAFIGT
jgi:type VI secretion system protein ImpM